MERNTDDISWVLSVFLSICVKNLNMNSIRLRIKNLLVILFIVCACCTMAFAQGLQPFSQTLQAKAQQNQDETPTKVPFITWGADIVAIYANGNTAKTTKKSIWGQSGLQLELFRGDDFQKQVEQFLQGQTPYLRGTMGMITMAAEICNTNPMTELVVIYQYSWSAGGDALVVKEGIKRISDLKGKTVAIQEYGPHVDYFTKLLQDAGLKAQDVRIVWTKDLVGPYDDTPMAKLYDAGIDAAFVIIPDALALTSSGTIGTGAEDSVKGARILLSTKTANRIISDVYAVRKDYFDSHRDEIKKFVKGLLQAEEAVKDLFRNPKSSQYEALISAAATMLLDSEQLIKDTEGLYHDAELSGFQGNVKFFTDTSYPRNFSKLSNEIQTSFLQLGLLKNAVKLSQANWDYDTLASGLKYANRAEAPKFKAEQVETMIVKRQQQDTLGEGALFGFEIYFKPNQNAFSADLYQEQFQKVVELASTYGGALITVEGHSDPMGYLRKKKDGQPKSVLKKIAQSAQALSLSRSNGVRDEIVAYAKAEKITLDPTQFATIGYGITNPKHPVPKTKQQWLDNMRVEFKVIQVEAEEDVFVPLD